jgi:hypothetical protein
MKISELNQIIENVISEEVRKTIINEMNEGKKEVYHIKCEGVPLATFDTQEEAEENLPNYKGKHKGELIIEKGVYESHDDMIDKLDEMNDQLEETDNMKNTQMSEKLVGNQSELDKNDNGKLDNQDFEMLRKDNNEEKEDCEECGQNMEEEKKTCEKCGKELCECGLVKESKKKVVRLKESELIDVIKKIIKESVPGLEVFKKAHSQSGKESNQHLSDVKSKITKRETFEGNDNPEFPKQIGKGEKEARVNSKEQDEEVAKNFAGLQNLEYDIEPSEKFKKRLKMAIEGHSTMGNAPSTEKTDVKPSNEVKLGDMSQHKEGNTIPTPETAKKLEKQVKDRQEDKKERVLYKKEAVPVNESKMNLSSLLNEEITRMKSFESYNKKTQ